MSDRKLAPGPKGNPFIGVLRDVRRDTIGFFRNTFATYGDTVTYRLGPLRSYLITHPDGVKRVLQEHVKNYTKDHVSYSIVRWLAGNGLLTSQGDFWLRQRRLVQPAFHRQRLAAMAAMMVQRTEAMLDRWEAPAAQGTALDMSNEMMQLTLDIVGDALFGTNVRDQAAAVEHGFSILSAQVVDRFRSFNLIPPVLPTRNDRLWRSALSEMDAVVYAIISERRKQDTDTGDLLSMLLLIEDADTGERMTDTQLRDEVLTMLVAGHETTATALTWAWGLLDQHPEVRSKLDAELAQVLGGRSPTMDDVPNLTYTRMIIDETMRLYPPVYIFSRHVVADDELNGYHIPKGASVDLSPYLTHRHPDFWEEPERFMPERFSAEQVAARHKYAYIPFSTGPRICIGNNFALLEMTLVLATVAQRYRPRLIAPTLPKALPLITLRPQDGMPMYLEAAEQAVLI